MKEKLSLLATLVKLAKIDNDFREEERKFIYTIAMRLGISPKDFVRVFHENIDFKPPKLETERILHFHRLVLLMNIDRNASSAEIELVKQLGGKMGLNPIAINTVLEKMYLYKNNVIPAEKLISIFKTYHN
ncbi:MAG TPA: TerB family tellurite resistance protein [Crocinitomix sp.]|nr:TerB family tellurite resistance protein [Crocinitomix sp.]